MSSDDSLDLYEGRVKIVRLDADRLAELESILSEFVGTIAYGEKMFVNVHGDVMSIRILRKKTNA